MDIDTSLLRFQSQKPPVFVVRDVRAPCPLPACVACRRGKRLKKLAAMLGNPVVQQAAAAFRWQSLLANGAQVLSNITAFVVLTMLLRAQVRRLSGGKANVQHIYGNNPTSPNGAGRNCCIHAPVWAYYDGYLHVCAPVCPPPVCVPTTACTACTASSGSRVSPYMLAV